MGNVGYLRGRWVNVLSLHVQRNHCCVGLSGFCGLCMILLLIMGCLFCNCSCLLLTVSVLCVIQFFLPFYDGVYFCLNCVIFAASGSAFIIFEAMSIFDLDGSSMFPYHGEKI